MGNRSVNRKEVLGSYKKGGKVKKTGLYKLHKGELVVPANKLGSYKKKTKSKNANKK